MVHWVTQRVVTSFNFIQVHQRVVGEGRRSDWWDVEVLTFQARTRIGLQRHRVILLPIITSFFSLWTNTHPLQILLLAALWIRQRHFKHSDYPAAVSLLCTEENCLKGTSMSHTRSASFRQFYFSRNRTQTDFQSPIKCFQSFNLA